MSTQGRRKGEQAFLGRGWGFPPTFTSGGADVEMVSNAEDIQQSLRILLGTTQGERVMQESFGCDLQGLLFEEGDRWLMARIERTIRDAISSHEPRITLDDVKVTGQDVREGTLSVSIRYTIRGTNSRFNMVFPFLSHGGNFALRVKDWHRTWAISFSWKVTKRYSIPRLLRQSWSYSQGRCKPAVRRRSMAKSCACKVMNPKSRCRDVRIRRRHFPRLVRVRSRLLPWRPIKLPRKRIRATSPYFSSGANSKHNSTSWRRRRIPQVYRIRSPRILEPAVS
jgi:uncharacterized protein